MTISLYEFFLILIIGQSIFLIFAIQYIPAKYSGANRMIQYLLAIYIFFLVERIFIPELETDFVLQYGYLINVFYLLIGPFIYGYVGRLLFHKNETYRLTFLHYLPAIMYFIYCLFHIFNFDTLKHSKSYFTFFLLCNEILFFVFMAFYLVKSNNLLNVYVKHEVRELSFNQTIVKYVRIMLVCLSLYLFFWLLGIMERFVFKIPIDIGIIYDLSCLIFGIQIYIIGFYSLKHREVFKIRYPSKKEDDNKKRTQLAERDIAKIKGLLDHFFHEEKGHCNPELSLSLLAAKIDTTTNKLSWVLNNHYNKTFYELVNEYRVEDFALKIKENKHKDFTVISIAYEVGFNSKSTFYKAFREITKMTPSEYIKQVENAEKG